MKRIVEKVKTHRKVVHAHLKKHHKKYFLWIISAALLIKIIPAFIAWLATWHFNFSFADEPVTTDTETSTASWWMEYKHWDFEYIIEWVDLNVYPIDSSKTTTVTTTEDGFTSTMTENDDMKKYIKEEPEKIIPLNSEDLTINPEYKRGTIDDYNTLFIDLNLNLTKDYLESKLSDEISKTTDEKSYIVDVVVKYKIKNYPTNFQYFLKVNYWRLMGGLFTESSNGEVNISNTISQVINVATITKEDSDSDPEVIIINEDNDLFSSIISYLILSEEDCDGIWLDIDSSGAHLRQFCWYDENDYENVEYVDSSKIQLFMFYTMDNIDYIKNWLKLEYEEDNDEWDNWWDDNWWDDNWWDDNWWDDNWWNDTWWDNNWWNWSWANEDEITGSWANDTEWVCSSNDLLVTYPISWDYLKLEDVRLTWHLSGSDCSGETFTIKIYGWTNTWYITLWTVSANSWEFDDLSWFNVSWLLGSKFAIFLWDSDPLKDSPDFYIDEEKPTVTSSYKFTPERTTTFGLNDKVDVIFTWSEELTWITVNVLWRNATLVSKTGLRYTYSIQLSSGNNSWEFIYNISFRDVAWNTWYYEYYNSGLTTDTTVPEISGLQFTRISDKTWHVSFSLTKTWNVTFKYVLSWWKATETLSDTNTSSFSTNLSKARTDKASYIYKYVITVEDLVWNKNYYAGTFQLSGNTLWYTLVTSSGSNIKTWTAVSMITILSDELSAFSGCKAKTGMNYSLIQYTVTVNRNQNIVKVQMPKFNDSTIKSSAETVSRLLVNALQWSTISWLNQSKLNVFAWELNDYFVLVKMKRDPEICDAKLSILPSLYMTRLLNTLKAYNIIN